MALIVQKYGGTSVGTLERIQHVADHIIATRARGHAVVAVVSAMSGETDRLIHLAESLACAPEAREYASLVSTGEQVSMSLLAMALIARGCPAYSYTGTQAKIQTDHDFKKARIVDIDPKALQEAISSGKVPVIAGFQGVDDLGNITTLGRGGSDTTAVAIAAALKADECQIYTDVDGVYTTDPRVVPQARLLKRITFEEMLEMASLGAKVLQIRSVEFAGKYNIPLRVLSSFHDGEGTLITFEQKGMEQPYVSAIAFNRNEAKITIVDVPDKPGIAAHILGPISAANIDIDVIVQNGSVGSTTNFTFTIHRDDYEKALELVTDSTKNIQAGRIFGNNKIAKLSLVGVGMRSHAGIASSMFEALAKEGINIQLISTSEIKISVIIDEKYLELGVRILHDLFGLDKEPLEESAFAAKECAGSP
jgi:aspartate kinase